MWTHSDTSGLVWPCSIDRKAWETAPSPLMVAALQRFVATGAYLFMKLAARSQRSELSVLLLLLLGVCLVDGSTFDHAFLYHFVTFVGFVSISSSCVFWGQADIWVNVQWMDDVELTWECCSMWFFSFSSIHQCLVWLETWRHHICLFFGRILPNLCQRQGKGASYSMQQ